MRRLAVCLVLLGIAVAGLRGQSPSGITRGQVVAAEDGGGPIPHARVVVYNEKEATAVVFADSDGLFSLPDFLESIAARATFAALIEGQTLSISARVVDP